MSSSRANKRRLEKMDFGKFLFLYLLGRNVDYFAYKQILDLVLKEQEEEEESDYDGDDDSSCSPSAPSCAKEVLRRAMSQPGVEDAGFDEIVLPRYDIITICSCFTL